MPEARTYTGSCHCGAVLYEATTDLAQVISCNCSRCSRLGWLLTFVPKEQFTLQAGEDALQDYRFNTHNIAHLFCKTCGIESFARGKRPNDGAEMVAVNVRCLVGVDLDSLTIKKVDNRSR
jgi:hypothetical protein